MKIRKRMIIQNQLFFNKLNNVCSFSMLQAPSTYSLLLSILQQMLLEDKEDRVKMSAINSIAFLVTFIDDDDKYIQVLANY